MANAGRYFIKSKTALLQALTLAGGLKPQVDRTRILVLPWNSGDAELKFRTNYPDILIRDRAEQNYLLKPGDTPGDPV